MRWSGSTNLTVSAAGPAHTGLAAAAFNAGRQFGSALGVAVLASLMTLTPHSIALPLATAALVYLTAAILSRRIP